LFHPLRATLKVGTNLENDQARPADISDVKMGTNLADPQGHFVLRLEKWGG
jgi:hypothetical protein